MKNKTANPVKVLKEKAGFDQESPLEIGITFFAMLLSLLLAGTFFYLIIRK